jgi:CRISPR-associated protein Csc3
MATLLQTLLVETLPANTDPILRSYIETVLPSMEREFALIPALGGSEEAHYQLLSKLGDPHAKAKGTAMVKSCRPEFIRFTSSMLTNCLEPDSLP